MILWVLWCALHSAIITTSVTGYLRTKLRDRYRYYRLFYNAVAFLTLVPLIYYSLSIDDAPIFRWQGVLIAGKYFLLLASIYLFIAAALHYRMSWFLGISQIRTGEINPTLSEDEAFDTTGLLGAMRHPWYLAGIMIVWARDISLSALLINLVISAYLVVGAILEERKLVHEFGEKYIDYQKHVSMFFPYKWLKNRIR